MLRKKKLIVSICLTMAVLFFAGLKMEGVSNVLASTVGKIINVSTVKLDKTSISMTPGTINILRATVTPLNATNKSVTWTSSDEKVAKVDQTGKVTAVGAGTAVITATVGGDKVKTAKCTVSVITKVSGVTLDQSNVSIAAGEKVALKATVNPDNATNKNVVWSSSNPAVAKVDQNGNVTAVKNGIAIIKVVTKDQSRTAQCVVKVTTSVESSISISEKSVTIDSGKTFKLTSTVYPQNSTANNSIVWTTSNPKVVTVDQSGNIKAISAGTATVTATIKGQNKSAQCTITVQKAEVFEVDNIS